MDRMLREERRDLLLLAGAAPVLDAGCGDGDLSFFFESLGCDVLAMDNWNPNFKRDERISRSPRALESKVEFRMCDFDGGVDLRGRTFGLALCLGVLYHLKNPYGVLETLARHVRYCVLSTRIAQVTPRGTPINSDPVAYLLDPFEANNDASNYWVFSEPGLHRILSRTGGMCAITRHWVSGWVESSDSARDQRAFCMLRSKLADPWLDVDLDGGWHALENAAGDGPSECSECGWFAARDRRCCDLRFRAPGPIRMRAFVGDEALNEQEYRTPGEHVYEHALPPGGDKIAVRFELDKARAPDATDRRELGVQVVFWSYSEPTPRLLRPIMAHD